MLVLYLDDMTKKAIIIGAGFGGLGTACLLAKDGWDVTVLEKNDQVGGRAGYFEAAGFRFDMGPSWFLMPDVFERFFESLGENIHDHVTLKKLSPSYRVTFKDQSQQLDIHSNLARDKKMFEAIEPGAGLQLETYLKQSEYVYKTAMEKFLYKNYDNAKSLMSWQLAKEAHKLSLLKTMDQYVSKYFQDSRLQQIMQYPLVFLGASPYNAPALYNLMSHVDFNQGVYYPMGGLYEVTKALERVARKHGVTFRLQTAATQIVTKNGKAVGVTTDGDETLTADVVISNADPHFTESKLLDAGERDHTERYWQSRTLAPSALLMYLGVDKKYPSLTHHNLVFSNDWQKNFAQIYDKPMLPEDPSFYVCAPSVTDKTVAPKGQENLFVLVPIAAGLTINHDELEDYADRILSTMEAELKLPDLRKHITYKRLFGPDDFTERYNSFQGTGLGLAHTLKQTALWRPSNKSKKVSGLYYVGANVHPGIGLPTCLISAELVASRLRD